MTIIIKLKVELRAAQEFYFQTFIYSKNSKILWNGVEIRSRNEVRVNILYQDEMRALLCAPPCFSNSRLETVKRIIKGKTLNYGHRTDSCAAGEITGSSLAWSPGHIVK